MKITEGRNRVDSPSTWAEKRAYLIELLNYQYVPETLKDAFDKRPDADKLLEQFKKKYEGNNK